MNAADANKLELVPVKICEAWAFIAQHHRHHRPHKFATFAIGAARTNEVVAVAVVGNPTSRMLNDGFTQEVTRLCSIDRTEGEHASGACSMLYAASWRACRSLGYRRLVTYTLPEEGGGSLRGAGWREIGVCGGGSWSRKERPRVDTHPMQEKLRWEIGDSR